MISGHGTCFRPATTDLVISYKVAFGYANCYALHNISPSIIRRFYWTEGNQDRLLLTITLVTLHP